MAKWKSLFRVMANPPPDPPRSLRGAPLNPGLQKLIEAKREWHYRPTAVDLRRGFRGWYERGYLPHFDAPNVTQIVTFMLEDSFPVWRRREWEPILEEPDPSLRRRKLEAWLDRGHGECWLRKPEVARRVEEIIRAEDGEKYRLQAWVIMPNHVHLVVDVWQTPLCALVAHWKGRSSHDANQLLGRRGAFWQRESFDTLIRDSDHLARAIHYSEHNPTKAMLVREAKSWPWSSARFRDPYNRLPWQTTGRPSGA
jgi:putative transposase